MKKCQNCGVKMEQDALFCRECGTRYEEIDSNYVNKKLSELIDNNRSKPLFLKIRNYDMFRIIGYLLAFVVAFLIAGPVGGVLGVALFYFVMKFVKWN